MNSRMNNRLNTLLQKLSDEEISILWVWVESTPTPRVLDRLTDHLQARGITTDYAEAIASN